MNEETMKPPMISIVMPTYNRARLIGDTLASIRGQSFENWELIIVDDGSTDDTAAVINAIGDPRVRYTRRPHSGIGAEVKNAGLALATGEYLAFMDSDDLWHSSKLAKQLDALERHPGAGFCICGGYNFIELNRPGRAYYKKTEGEYYGNIFSDFFDSGWPAYTQTLLVRRDCVQEVGAFPESGSFAGGDLDFLLSLALRFHAVILYEALFFHRLHPGTFSLTDWEQSSLEGIRAIRYHASKGHLHPADGKRALFRAYIRLGEKYLQHGEKRKAVRVLLKAWTGNPFKWVAVKKLGKGLLYRTPKVNRVPSHG